MFVRSFSNTFAVQKGVTNSGQGGNIGPCFEAFFAIGFAILFGLFSPNRNWGLHLEVRIGNGRIGMYAAAICIFETSFQIVKKPLEVFFSSVPREHMKNPNGF